jgi:hypothetical protein
VDQAGTFGAVLPRVLPMKASTGDLPVDERGWGFEVKWDGMLHRIRQADGFVPLAGPDDRRRRRHQPAHRWGGGFRAFHPGSAVRGQRDTDATAVSWDNDRLRACATCVHVDGRAGEALYLVRALTVRSRRPI